MRSRSRDEEEEEQFKRRQLQEDHLSKVTGHGRKKILFCLSGNTLSSFTERIHGALITEMHFYNTTDPVWSWKAHFEGGDGEGNEQREICSQCGSPAVRASAQLYCR